jgi:hypothetical protein
VRRTLRRRRRLAKKAVPLKTIANLQKNVEKDKIPNRKTPYGRKMLGDSRGRGKRVLRNRMLIIDLFKILYNKINTEPVMAFALRILLDDRVNDRWFVEQK